VYKQFGREYQGYKFSLKTRSQKRKEKKTRVSQKFTICKGFLVSCQLCDIIIINKIKREEDDEDEVSIN
jgi:hypothetical protein